MIATVVFWPRLVHGTRPLSERETRRVVEEAAETMIARYGARTTIDFGEGTVVGRDRTAGQSKTTT